MACEHVVVVVFKSLFPDSTLGNSNFYLFVLAFLFINTFLNLRINTFSSNQTRAINTSIYVINKSSSGLILTLKT